LELGTRGGGGGSGHLFQMERTGAGAISGGVRSAVVLPSGATAFPSISVGVGGRSGGAGAAGNKSAGMSPIGNPAATAAALGAMAFSQQQQQQQQLFLALMQHQAALAMQAATAGAPAAMIGPGGLGAPSTTEGADDVSGGSVGGVGGRKFNADAAPFLPSGALSAAARNRAQQPTAAGATADAAKGAGAASGGSRAGGFFISSGLGGATDASAQGASARSPLLDRGALLSPLDTAGTGDGVGTGHGATPLLAPLSSAGARFLPTGNASLSTRSGGAAATAGVAPGRPQSTTAPSALDAPLAIPQPRSKGVTAAAGTTTSTSTAPGAGGGGDSICLSPSAALWGPDPFVLLAGGGARGTTATAAGGLALLQLMGDAVLGGRTSAVGGGAAGEFSGGATVGAGVGAQAEDDTTLEELAQRLASCGGGGSEEGGLPWEPAVGGGRSAGPPNPAHPHDPAMPTGWSMDDFE